MTERKNKPGIAKYVRLIVLGLFGLGLTITMLLQGTDVALLNPSGFIAGQQRSLMFFSVIILLAVAVPTLIMLYFFAWKYRESNTKAAYDPGVRHGKLFVFSMWAVPSFFMLVLALVMWTATHKLEHNKPIASATKPITIQVVAMRWKWLFIYPEQNIATVNFVQIPVDTPIQFELTADETPMSSFWIPHFGGQLYAMTGHSNRLNLMAEEPGDYPGSTAEINGSGFAGMKFIARVTTEQDFDLWVQEMRGSSEVLDTAEYNNLLKPSENNPAAYYSSTESTLFDNLLMKYNGAHNHQPQNSGGNEQ